jgi:quercetin dioxygenase-like cupin family protein
MWREAFAAGVTALSAIAATAATAVNPADLKWGPAPTGLPKGATMAVLAGDPNKPERFLIRLNLPPGYRIPPHRHPSDEYVTVISGDFRVGMGDKLDPAKAKPLGAGGFALAPQRMNHFAWTEHGAVVQVSAEGPFVIVYANPADDPRRKPPGR